MSQRSERIGIADVEIIEHSGNMGNVRGGGGVSNSGAAWSERRGLLIRLVDDQGRQGLGEASPLPGYSPDSLIDTRHALETWRRGADSFEASIASIRRHVSSLPSTRPAARFGLETALLDLLGQHLDQPVPRLLSEASGRDLVESVPVAAVLSHQPVNELLAEVATLFSSGVRSLKLKIGYAGEFDTEVEKLQALRHRYGDTLRLRLDANGRLPVDGLQERLQRLAEVGPEFVEEPVPWPAIAALDTSPVPLALDESLLRPGLWSGLPRWLATGACGVVVLKPLLHGGVLACLELAQRLESLVPVASHGFDGPVALVATNALALALGDRLAHGVAPHAGLEPWHSAPQDSLAHRSHSVDRLYPEGRLVAWSTAGYPRS